MWVRSGRSDKRVVGARRVDQVLAAETDAVRPRILLPRSLISLSDIDGLLL